MRSDARHRAGGFTLVEVLVALAIIAFGLIAVFGQLSQSATAAGRLRDKTLAHWVAMNTLTELRLRGDFPAVGTQSDDVELAGVRWRYQIKVAETASDALRRADVTVAFEEDPDRPVASLVGFLPRPTQAGGLVAAGAGWPLLSPDGAAPEAPAPATAPPPGSTPQSDPGDGAGGAAQ